MHIAKDMGLVSDSRADARSVVGRRGVRVHPDARAIMRLKQKKNYIKKLIFFSHVRVHPDARAIMRLGDILKFQMS
jgi:hypothetical protein